MKPLELQAIVMSGGNGSRFPMLSNAPPKCLLPVGPYPLIWYSLSLLERQGFQEAIVIVKDAEKCEIAAAVDKLNLKLKIDYAVIPADDDMGTAESLRSIHDKIVTDVLIISCDFITEINLDGMINLFRKHDASAVSLMFDNGSQEFIQVPGPKSKVRPERDLVGIDKETQRLVFLASASDFDETVTLPQLLLKKHPVLSMHSKLLDSHTYILKKWIIDFLVDEQHFTTVKGELLPYIIKKQLSKPSVADVKNASVCHIATRKDIFNHAVQNELDEKIKKVSSYNDHSHGMKGCYHEDIIRCYAYIPDFSNYAIRVNTLPTFCLINSKIINKWNDIAKGAPLVKIHPKSSVKSSQIDEFTIVGENSEISEKTSIKNTIIGSSCFIKNKVSLKNCVLMNNITIEEGCQLQDCIIYSGATIKEQCAFSFCIIGPQHTTSPKEKADHVTIPEASEDMIELE